MPIREHNIQPLLPSGYRQLEYIEGTGTQWIETSIYLTNKHYVEARFNVTIGSGSYMFGSHQQGRYIDNSMFVADTYILARIRNGSSTNETITYNDELVGQWHTYGNGNKVFTIDGMTKGTYSTNYTFTAGAPCYIFKSNNYRVGYTSPPPVQAKLNIFNIILNDNYVFNGLPALRMADSKPGLYDLDGSICPLTGTPFYVNAGTGEFLYA